MASTAQPIRESVDTYAGLRRVLDVGVRIAPTRQTATAAAKALSAFLDAEPAVPVRIAGLAADDSRVLITLAVTMGDIDDIKVAAPEARAALELIQRIVDELACYDPAFATLPRPSSAEARLAAHVMAHPEQMSMALAVQRLAGVG
ncbi:MAG: hypothetical protein GC156_03620 [Actinomycetales bacterium]|nr:hypothetical protein [Actinomycetales bacterium]